MPEKGNTPEEEQGTNETRHSESQHFASSVLHRCFTDHYCTTSGSQDDNAWIANDRLQQFFKDFDDKNPLALDLRKYERLWLESYGRAMDALYSAYDRGEADPYEDEEANAYRDECDRIGDLLDDAFFLWAKARAPQDLKRRRPIRKPNSRTGRADGSDSPGAMTAASYPIHTGQEMDVLFRSACDGDAATRWRNEDMRSVRVFEMRDLSHRVEIAPRNEELDSPMSALANFEALTKEQDADFAYCILYICGVLAPPSPLPSNRAATGWINLDDVMTKIGWQPSKFNLARRAEMRARLWHYIVFADRAAVLGRRSVPYRDPHTREEIETVIESPLWRIMSTQTPLQKVLFDDPRQAPVQVELVVSKQWEPLLTHRHLAQFLPLGELLGGIPSNQVAGDWARCFGLTLANLWRRKVRESENEGFPITRRELLTRYTPKTSVQDILESNNPSRAIEYFCGALDILSGLGFLARSGEASRTITEIKSSLPRKGWKDIWLDETIQLFPGGIISPAIAERARALPVRRPQNLSKKKRGRPRKASA